MYDILLLSGKKDLNKIKYVYESIVSYLEGYNKIYCICEEIPKEKVGEIIYFDDNDVLYEYNLETFKGNVKLRKNWYIQQYIKLLQQVTIDDYLVVDTDILFNRKVDIITDGKPNFLFGRDQHHKPYFEFTKKLLNIDKIYKHSFINEVMYFKRDILNDIFKSLNVDKKGFFDLTVKILNNMNEDAGMSEYEMYGSYVYKNHRDVYNFKHIKTFLGGKASVWTNDEVYNFKKTFENQDYDIVSMHSWI